MSLCELIDKHSVEIEVFSPNGGEYVSGQFIPNERQGVKMEGAIIGTPSVKNYGNGGYYNSSNINLFIKGPPLGENLIIKYDEKYYHVEEYRNYNRVSGFTKYILKQQDAGQ